jgi:hypothetical protein
MTGSEIEDRDIWPDDRLARAELEIAEEKKRRADAAAASKMAELTAEQKEANSMKQLGDMQAVEARRQILKEFGFDPGWR